MDLIIYTDGGSRGNPGKAGVGLVLYDAQLNLLEQVHKYIGTKTNNEAEYTAVLFGFTLAEKFKPTSIAFYLDSELIVKQLTGKYKIKNDRLLEFATKIKDLQKKYAKVTYTHIPREKNKLADKLVNLALDTHDRTT